ncbi:MAG: TetR/AcrR family transcriptional regulator [Bradyrhizobium sp.]
MDVASVEGFEGLTVGSLASDLSIGKSNISALFGDKQTLQIKTLDAAVAVFTERVIAPTRAEISPLKRLRRLCSGWFDYVERRVFPGGCIMYAAINEYRAKPGPLRDKVSAYRDAWKALLERTIREAQSAAEIGPHHHAQQLTFKLIAFQAASNAAALLGDEKHFKLGRELTEAAIAEAANAGPPALSSWSGSPAS